MAARNSGRVISAIIGNNVKVIQFSRIIHLLKVFNNISDNRLLVVGRHKDKEPALRIMRRIISGITLKAKNRQKHLINQHEHQPCAQDGRNALQNVPQRHHVQAPPLLPRFSLQERGDRAARCGTNPTY